MTTLRTFLVCLALLGCFGAGWIQWDARMDERDAQTRRTFALERERQAMDLAVKRAEQDQFLKRQQSVREQESKARRIQQLGGAVVAALKDPDAGIAETIEAVARAVIPNAEQVVVRVDRFVEFQLTVELAAAASQAQLAVWSRDLVLPLSRYLHALRFVTAGAVVGQLDRPAIEELLRVQERGGDLIALALQLLRPATESRATAREPSAAPAAPSVAPLTPSREAESEPAIRVNRELAEAVHAHSKEFAEGLRDIYDTVDRLGREGPAGVSSCRETVQRFRERLPMMRASLVDPASELDRRLAEAGVDEVYRRAAVRTLRRDSPSTRDGERMIAQVRKYCDVLLHFLDTMDQHRAGWTVLPELRRIQFLDSELFEVYREVSSVCEREQKETQAAIVRWQSGMKAEVPRAPSP